ncbi:MAG: hypothetical protein AAGB48_11415 [Planctomycetota bacterium]
MDAVTIRPRSRGAKPCSTAIGERADRIEGSYRQITVHQLVLAIWLYQTGQMTRRQLRLYYAAHELDERRRYTSPEHRGSKPLYTVAEFAKLVGGRDSEKAARELRADMRRLARLGLVTITKHRIAFATSADQITLGSSGGVDDLSGFWAMFNAMPNRRRTVPVPRRLLRALAAGFSKGVTALITAVLIRGLFWHRETSDYRTDGRFKLSWVAEHFGISRRAATDARNKLIELGWLEPLEVNQWEMNRWGVRDRIVPEWSHTDTRNKAVGEGERVRESATPNADFDGESASPDLTDSLSLTGDQKTRRLPTRERSGVSPGSTLGSRKKSRRGKLPPKGEPNIRDIQPTDLGDTARLFDLYHQACELGLAAPGDAGRLDFLSLAERARCRGKRAGALFFWLLREKKTAFITHADEEEAARRIREFYNGPRPKRPRQEEWGGSVRRIEPEWTDEDKIVMACLRIAQQRRISDPFHLARQAKGWARDRWDAAHMAYLARRNAQFRTEQDPGT